MIVIMHEWGALLLRWVHIVAGIAWVGSSFYFMHVDAAMRPVAFGSKGADGEVWEVHGGGFYEVRKYLVAPASLPPELLWHKWESYATWLSGFSLLVWTYYFQASLFLIDPAILNIGPIVAALIGVGALLLGWLVYDRLCKSRIGDNDVALAAVCFAFIVGMAAFFQHVFSPRGAFIHTGALMATIMSANVFMVIIPNQSKAIALLKAGKTPDAKLGQMGKVRSTHNNYLTLPVLFLMISNHYPMTFSSPYAWAVVALMLIAGALVRVFYNLRHEGRGDKWWTWAVAAACVCAAVAITMSASSIARDELGMTPLDPPRRFAGEADVPKKVASIVVGRCSMCHANEPVWDGIAAAPKGIKLDTPADMARHAREIYMQAVLTRAMPPNNITEISDGERRALRDWIEAR